jgi:hypothetical protein
MSTIRFAKAGSKFSLHFAYDPKLVELTKSIPSWARGWDAGTKTWTIDAQYAHALAADFRALGHTVAGLEAQQERARRAPPPPPPPPPALPPADSWAVLLLDRAAAAGLELPVYRALARVLHTDVGGDSAMMAELNTARKATQRRAAG